MKTRELVLLLLEKQANYWVSAFNATTQTFIKHTYCRHRH